MRLPGALLLCVCSFIGDTSARMGQLQKTAGVPKAAHAPNEPNAASAENAASAKAANAAAIQKIYGNKLNVARAAQLLKAAGAVPNQRPLPGKYIGVSKAASTALSWKAAGASANQNILLNKVNAARAAQLLKAAGTMPKPQLPGNVAKPSKPAAAARQKPRPGAGMAADATGYKETRPGIPNTASAARSTKTAGKAGNQKRRPNVSKAAWRAKTVKKTVASSKLGRSPGVPRANTWKSTNAAGRAWKQNRRTDVLTAASAAKPLKAAGAAANQMIRQGASKAASAAFNRNQRPGSRFAAMLELFGNISSAEWNKVIPPGALNTTNATQSAKAAGASLNNMYNRRGSRYEAMSGLFGNISSAEWNKEILPGVSDVVSASHSANAASESPHEMYLPYSRPGSRFAAMAGQFGSIANAEWNKVLPPGAVNARKMMNTSPSLPRLSSKVWRTAPTSTAFRPRWTPKDDNRPPSNSEPADAAIPRYYPQDLLDLEPVTMNITGDWLETEINRDTFERAEFRRRCPLPSPELEPSRRWGDFNEGASRDVKMLQKNYMWHPSLKEGLRGTIVKMMQNNVYSATNRLKTLSVLIDRIQAKIETQFTFRLGFVFPRMEAQLRSIRNMYTYMMNYRKTTRNRVTRVVFVYIFYLRRAMIKYWDIVYMVERCSYVYNAWLREISGK